MEDLTGKQFGPYQIVAPLGQGGMAAVYKAYQPSMERYVAVKVLPRQMADSAEFITRFKREAHMLAQLQHPHILPVFDYGESEGYTYIVMSFVKSGTLADQLKTRRMALPEIRRVMTQVGDALGYAHTRGMIHRDVKPSNVLIDERGNCLLTDFGLARMTEASVHLTSSGAIVGTPAYMSPEQGAGAKVDGRSDIYSLGIILYEMITGQVPYSAETPIAIVLKHIQGPLPLARKLAPDLSEELELVLLKSLAKSPADRYQSAEDFVQAIRLAIPSHQAGAGKPVPSMRATTAVAAPRPILPAPVVSRPVYHSPTVNPPTTPRPLRTYEQPPAAPPPPVYSPVSRQMPPKKKSFAAQVLTGTSNWLWLGLAGFSGLATLAIVIFVFLYLFGIPQTLSSIVVAQSTLTSVPEPTEEDLFIYIPSDEPSIWGMVLEDDFSDPDSGWTSLEDGERITDYEDDQYRIFVKVPNSIYRSKWNQLEQDFADIAITVTATKVGGTDDSFFGIVCRDNENGYYQFEISSNGYGRIMKRESDHWASLSDWVFSEAIEQGAATNQIIAECLGNTLTLVVNGEEIISVTDTSFSKGAVGLFAGTFDVPGTDILFDDFTMDEYKIP